ASIEPQFEALEKAAGSREVALGDTHRQVGRWYPRIALRRRELAEVANGSDVLDAHLADRVVLWTAILHDDLVRRRGLAAIVIVLDREQPSAIGEQRQRL